MTTVATMSAAPLEIEVNGRKLILGRLRDKDYGFLLTVVQDRIFDLASRNLSKVSDAEDRQSLLQFALEKSSRVTMQSREVTDYLNTFEGVVKLLWLSLRREQPSITEEEVVSLVSDPNTFEQLSNKLTFLGFLSAKGGESPKKRTTALLTG